MLIQSYHHMVESDQSGSFLGALKGRYPYKGNVIDLAIRKGIKSCDLTQPEDVWSRREHP